MGSGTSKANEFTPWCEKEVVEEEDDDGDNDRRRRIFFLYNINDENVL